MTESDPNIIRRRFVTHPSRGMMEIFPAEVKAFLLEPIDASDQLISTPYELLERQREYIQAMRGRPDVFKTG